MSEDPRKDQNGMWKIGAHVIVIRARHQWYDGRVEGVVTERYVNPRSPIGSCSFVVQTDQEGDLEINRARDLR